MSNVTPIKKPAREAAVWLSPAQVCERVPGMTEDMLSHLRKARKGPAFYKPTLKTTLYLESEVDAWVAQSRVQTREPKP